MRRFHTLIWAMTVAALVLALAPAALAEGNCCPDLGEGQLAELDQGRTSLLWRVFAEHARVRLTVSTPCGVFDRVYDKGEDPFFDIRELDPDDPNGSYTWQIRVDPVVDPAVAKALQQARNSGNDEIVKELRRKGLLPAGPFVQTGAFRVVEGAIVDPNAGGEKEGSTVRQVSSEDSVRRVTAADIVHNDDVIIHNSLCVGFDCVNNEVFNADTIRLKENNLRIHVDDTSTATGFPNQDWRLEFNSQNSGGGEYFRVIDVTASRNIMTLEANAPSNSLVVDDTGRVGLGTANPVLELHIANGDTPSLRLEQTTASGFAAQTWDIAGNETNFFVRDVTGGSTLPFRIRPGAPSSTIDIASDGDVAIGLSSPTNGVKVHIRTADPNVALFESTESTNDVAFLLINNGGSTDFNSTGIGSFNESLLLRAGDATRLTVEANGALTSSTGATLSSGGMWIDASSRELKEGISELTAGDALEALAGLQPVRYRYLANPDEAHVGFIAEEVPELVAMSDRKGLSPMEIVAVLTKVLQEQRLVSAEQDALIQDQQRRLAELAERLEVLAGSSH